MKNIITICCVCEKIKPKDKWIKPSNENYQSLIQGKSLSHGYCPVCYEEQLEVMRN